MLFFLLQLFFVFSPAAALSAANEAIAAPAPAEALTCAQQNVSRIRQEAEKGHAWAQTCLGRLHLEETGFFHFNKYAKALRWLKKAADQGDLEAVTELGQCYEHGKGVERDRVQAVELYLKAAEGGYAPAQTLLADCYADYIGIGVPADREKAVLWYEKAAAQEDAKAQYSLGTCYESGKGIPKDILRALELYDAALRAGESAALHKFADIHAFGVADITGPDRRKEAWFLIKGALNGEPWAMETIAHDYQGHYALPQSYAKALEWAMQCDAQTRLKREVSRVESVNFAREIGKFDNSRAKNIPDSYDYSVLSQSRNPGDWYELGRRYWKSNGEGDAHEQAARWFARAAEADYIPALKDLAFCYLVGVGVPQDDAMAYASYERAARLGDAEAEDFVGFCHEYGIGVPMDRERAVVSYSRAAEAGNPASQFGMAFRYMHGWGVQKDEQKALELYSAAANTGYYRAMNALAKCYEQGIGVPKDGAKAWNWYKKSYETNGIGSQDFTAKHWLENHNPDGSPKMSEEEKKILAKAAAGDGRALGRLGFDAIHKDSPSEEELRRGVEWLQKAVEAGNESSFGWLAHCYQNGLGVPRDLAKAFTLWKQLAERGGKYHQASVAHCYEDGIGVERDRAKAVMWYKKGAALGDSRAREALDELGY